MNNTATPRSSSQQGFSIVELLIAVALGLVLTVGLISVFISSKQGYRVQESRSRMQESARFAMDYLSQAIRLADFWGGADPSLITAQSGLAYAGPGASCTSTWIVRPQAGLRGYLGAAAYPAGLAADSGDGGNGCINSANYEPNTDALMVRYADPDDVVTNAGPCPATAAEDDSSNACIDTDDLNTALAARNAATLFVRVLGGARGFVYSLDSIAGALAQHPFQVKSPGAVINYHYKGELYYIRTPGTGPAIPSLYVNRNLATGASATALVEGIEMMRFEYGLDTNNDNLVDTYRPANTVGDWSQVLSVRIGLIVRGDARDAYNDTDSYNLPGGYTYTPAAAAQRFQRIQVIREVQVRNRVTLR